MGRNLLLRRCSGVHMPSGSCGPMPAISAWMSSASSTSSRLASRRRRASTFSYRRGPLAGGERSARGSWPQRAARLSQSSWSKWSASAARRSTRPLRLPRRCALRIDILLCIAPRLRPW